MASFSLLVFDWDGTLADSEARIVHTVRAAFNDLGLPRVAPEAVRETIGLGLREAFARLLPQGGEERLDLLVERYRHHFLHGERRASPLFPGVSEVLASLRAEGYALAVATGKSRAGLRSELTATGVAEFFDATRCADETCSKPHPQMLLELMEELGAEPHETLMIGDTEYDLQMARSARAHAAAVTYGAHPCPRLLQFAPLVCLDSLADLPPWLERGRPESAGN